MIKIPFFHEQYEKSNTKPFFQFNSCSPFHTVDWRWNATYLDASIRHRYTRPCLHSEGTLFSLIIPEYFLIWHLLHSCTYIHKHVPHPKAFANGFKFRNCLVRRGMSTISHIWWCKVWHARTFLSRGLRKCLLSINIRRLAPALLSWICHWFVIFNLSLSIYTHMHCRYEIAEILLKSKRVRLEFDGHSFISWMLCRIFDSSYLHKKIACMLLEAGGDMVYLDRHGCRPLRTVIYGNNRIFTIRQSQPIIELLIEAGIPASLDEVKPYYSYVKCPDDLEFCDWLTDITSKPRSLREQCRSLIRNNFGIFPNDKIKQLGLPPTLEKYVTLEVYRDWWSFTKIWYISKSYWVS